jgi:hypothetical protein
MLPSVGCYGEWEILRGVFGPVLNILQKCFKHDFELYSLQVTV